MQSINRDKNIIFISKLGIQLSPNVLVASEQYTLGGINTVRAYPRNILIGDNAVFISNEIRIPVFNDEEIGRIELIPFLDFGTVWNNGEFKLDPDTIASIGGGFSWRMQDDIVFEFFAGIPLVEIKTLTDSLSSNGVNLQAGVNFKF